MTIKLRKKPGTELGKFWASLERASRDVRKWPVRTCEECGGRKVQTYEVDNGGGWDRMYEEQTCRSCSGKGTYGGGKPGLSLWFQSEEACEEFKAKVSRMKGITWIADSENSRTLEQESDKVWKDA